MVLWSWREEAAINKYMIGLCAICLAAGCRPIEELRYQPRMTAQENEHVKRAAVSAIVNQLPTTETQSHGASLWNDRNAPLFGDHRAKNRGDILTVVIEIDDQAELKNNSQITKSTERALAIPQLFGIPQRVDKNLPDGASLSNAVDLSSSKSSSGGGSMARNEKVQFNIAATVLDVLPNGILHISGSQDILVNFEKRELRVSGYIRSRDITRFNKISYEKIASAEISYGGVGSLSRPQRQSVTSKVIEEILPY